MDKEWVMRRVSAVMGFMGFALAGVLLMSGCQSTGVNEGVYGSDNLYGDPLIADIPLNSFKRATYRKHTGWVPQQPLLFNDTIAIIIHYN